MSGEDGLLQCYNRGCGQKYDPNVNSNDSCRHHPGEPFFHDAYKGWSCCNKKCTDFTEFLNIKGCILSKHSSVKPPEPEKRTAADMPDTDVIEVKPIVTQRMMRPSFDTPLIHMTPELAPSIKQQLNSTEIEKPVEQIKTDPSEVIIGTLCKRGCNTSYMGPETEHTTCVYHAGSPIFHEGMKYWSCCQKKTSDFNAFLNQVGCTRGKHLWIKEESKSTNMECRWDYHQTGSHVIVSVYAKQYCPNKSVIKLNPVRMYVHLVFPQQDGACFNLDVELKGIVDIKASQVIMFGTKVEIKLKKAEPGSWSMLNVAKLINETPKKEEEIEKITPRVDAVDLSDI